ncbi:MAG: SpoIIE family protein phosphatase [Anaerovoracaceae bacterium]
MKEQLAGKIFGVYLLIGALYFVLTLPLAGLTFDDGYSQIRFTSLMPMAAGMLFGFPGALSCALGNLVGDIYSGLDIYCIFGFLGNFLMGWLPYKLWHTLFFFDNHTPKYLETSNSIVKFVSISVITSCASVGTIAAGGQLLQGFSFGTFFLPVSLEYYDLSLLGGILIFQICLTVFGIKPRIPQKAYAKKYQRRRFTIDYILAGVIVISSIIVTSLTFNLKLQDSTMINSLCAAILICSVILACLPIDRGPKGEKVEEKYIPVIGMKSQFVTIFLLILCAFLVVFTIVCYRILSVDFRYFTAGLGTDSLLWNRIIIGVAVAGTSLILVLHLLLTTIERRVIKPVEGVTEYARQFLAGDKIDNDKLTILRAGNELDDLGESVNVMTDNIRDFIEDIRQRTAKEERMAVELSVARNIQQGLLPEDWHGTGFDLVPYIKPAREVGGDFYHFSQLDEDRIFICIADVSGKDISAAMFMVQAKILIEANCNLPADEMLTLVNNTLSRSNKAMMFVTAFAGIIDRKNKTISYGNAGHNPPICLNNGKVCWLDDYADFVLGPMEDVEYKLTTMQIGDDFTLFIYTDGVNEAENKDHKFFTDKRLFQSVNESMKKKCSCEELIKQLESELGEFTKDAKQSDDITMLAVKIR